MNREQLISFTSAFPPAQKMTEVILDFNYSKAYHSYMNAIVVFCASVAAIFTVAKEKWTEYDCTERVQLFFLTAKEKTTQFIEWTKEIAIPEIQCLYDDCRKLSL